MVLRKFMSFMGRLLYRQQYEFLKVKLLEEYGEFKRTYEGTYNKTLEKLLVSGEDHRFLHHFGFDFIAICRAVKKRIFNNKSEGASTIEQQVVRVLTNDFRKTFSRKIKEIFLSTTLSELVPKKDLPGIYLHIAYFGNGMIGLKQVFKKLHIYRPHAISNETCAEIIARIKYPEAQKQGFKRARQIEMRKDHLLHLYDKHRSYKFFRIYG